MNDGKMKETHPVRGIVGFDFNNETVEGQDTDINTTHA